jgi:long-chain acyl-CoA synthetase
MTFRNYRNVHEMLKETVERQSDQDALKWFDPTGQAKSMTWAQYYGQVKRVARSLMAVGVAPGDKVAIISQSCPQWVMVDLGCAVIGACTVGIYPSNLPEDCRYILEHSDSVAVFVQDHIQLAKVASVREDLPQLQHMVLFSEKPAGDEDDALGFEPFLKLGSTISQAQLTARIESVGPGDPAGIIYTSGTTGVPKGAVLTHDNLTFPCQSVLHSGTFEPGDVTFLFLPLAHVFARTCFYTAIITGTTVCFLRSMETLGDELRAARPHWFVSVPRIFEKIFDKINHQVEEKGGVALKLFKWARQVGMAVGECRIQGAAVPWTLKMQHRLADKMIFSKIRDAFGGRVRWCISGAAPLNPEIGKFFHACGILILEGLGMTENTSFSNVNRPDNYRFGWVGPPGPGIEQSLAEDGEILFRGRNVMREYYKMPNETAAALTSDGWLRSGDLGEIDEENFLRITGRIKDIIITAGGKNIAPAPIEIALVGSKFISQALVIGDKRHYLTALVALEPEAVSAWFQTHNLEEPPPDKWASNPEVNRLIDAEIEAVNAKLPSFATIKKVAIAQAFTVEDGLLTPTLKLRKHKIAQRYRHQIDALYQG